MPTLHENNVAAYGELLLARAVQDQKIRPDQVARLRWRYQHTPRDVARLLAAPVSEGGLIAGVAKPLPAIEDDAYPAGWLGATTAPGSVMTDEVA